MFEEPTEIIILGLAGFVLLFEHIILLWCRHGIIRVIKERFMKHGVHLIKVFQTGGIELGYSKPREKFKFGKGQFSTTTFNVKRHHFDTKTGKPVVVLVEGNPSNVNLKEKSKQSPPDTANINEKFPPQKNAELIEQAIIRAENYGITKTLSRVSDAMKQNKWVLILVIAAIAAAGIAAYFGYQNQDLLQQLMARG